MKLYTLEEGESGVLMHINLAQICLIWHVPAMSTEPAASDNAVIIRAAAYRITTADNQTIAISEKDYNQILSELRTK